MTPLTYYVNGVLQKSLKFLKIGRNKLLWSHFIVKLQPATLLKKSFITAVFHCFCKTFQSSWTLNNTCELILLKK